MSELFVKILTTSSIAILISFIFNRLRRGSNNRGLFYFGLIPVLIALAIVGFDLTRKRYNESDYSTKQITVKGCRVNESSDGIITATDNSVYPFNRSLLWRVGSAPELALLLCHQKNLKIWLNPEKEISAFEGEQFSIPLEIGIARDDSKHGFLFIALMMGFIGAMIMGIAIKYDRMGKKIDLNTGKAY